MQLAVAGPSMLLVLAEEEEVEKEVAGFRQPRSIPVVKKPCERTKKTKRSSTMSGTQALLRLARAELLSLLHQWLKLWRSRVRLSVRASTAPLVYVSCN